MGQGLPNEEVAILMEQSLRGELTAS
jgi:hypothetical protein